MPRHSGGMSIERNRDPKGIPTGGQFAAGRRGEGGDGISLTVPSVPVDSDGSASLGSLPAEALVRVTTDDPPRFIAQVRPDYALEGDASEADAPDEFASSVGPDELARLSGKVAKVEYLRHVCGNDMMVEVRHIERPSAEVPWGTEIDPNDRELVKAAAQQILEAQDDSRHPNSAYATQVEAGLDLMSDETARKVAEVVKVSPNDGPERVGSVRPLRAAMAVRKDADAAVVEPYLKDTLASIDDLSDAQREAIAANPGEKFNAALMWTVGLRGSAELYGTKKDHRVYERAHQRARYLAASEKYGSPAPESLYGAPSAFDEERVPGIVEQDNLVWTLSPARNAEMPPRWRNEDGHYIGYHARQAVTRQFLREFRDFDSMFAGDGVKLPRTTAEYREAEAKDREAFFKEQGA